MVNTKIRLIIFFAAKDVEVLYSQQKQDWELTVAQIMNSSSAQFSSVTQSRPILWDSMNHSTPGLPFHQQLPEFTQTHVHQVGDAIQPSHPLSSSSPLAFNLSQHQGLFQWISSWKQVAKVLKLQYQSFRWISGLISFRGLGFNSWVGKIPWRRKWQPTSVFLPEKSHGQRSLAGYSWTSMNTHVLVSEDKVEIFLVIFLLLTSD